MLKVPNIVQSCVFVLIISLVHLCFCQQTDSLTSTSSLTDSDTIQSSGQVFQLGFFTLPNTNNSYLGIFYIVSPETIIWVANRDQPLNDTSSRVTIARNGNLVLTNGQNQTFWSTNITGTSRRTTAQLLDTGNLLLTDNSTGALLWESFSQPSHIFLPTMRLTENINTDTKVSISSWRSSTDPAAGNFTTGLEALNIPQMFTWRNGQPYWRSGPWNGHILIGVQAMYSPYRAGFSIVNDNNGTFYFTVPQGRFLIKILLLPNGTLVHTLWNGGRRAWDVTWIAPKNECDIYGTCGSFGSCHSEDTPICSCLRGFEPANQGEWDDGNWTGGCVRRRQLQCSQNNTTGGNRDGFLRLSFTKVPDFAEQFASRQINECRTRCSGNCSCIAYAYDSNIGCMFWSNSLIDVQRFDGAGIDLYIRLDASEFGNHQGRRLVIIIPVVLGGFTVICTSILICWCCIVKRNGKKAKDKKVLELGQSFSSDSTVPIDETEKVNVEELPLFTFETLAAATDQFNEKNLLGKGGFGPVYKGILGNGKEIAVKRLSAASGQGNEEFKNEVVVISKLQHRNLVRLSGYCVEREEKLLIYEYMPNKSLDGCLFDPTHPSQKILDWTKRVGIIEGIGRGLLYLHRDSRLKIIHRDLKPSNVLLDEDWNPKISDFGMARIFGCNEEHGDTARVVGTYGYMAPEYAIEGRFSEKSDVYSFGVLMLEILSGKKNTNYYNEELSLSLQGCAWRLWNEGNGLAFVDQAIASPNIQEDIARYIHIALLCVQEFPKDRPAIQTVLSMLSREIVDLPTPDEPVFAEKWNQTKVGTTQGSSQIGSSANELTVTVLLGR